MTTAAARHIDDLSGTEARELLAKLLAMALDPTYTHEDLGADVRITLEHEGFEVEEETED